MSSLQSEHLPVLPIYDPPRRGKSICLSRRRSRLVLCPPGADNRPVQLLVILSETKE